MRQADGVAKWLDGDGALSAAGPQISSPYRGPGDRESGSASGLDVTSFFDERLRDATSGLRQDDGAWHPLRPPEGGEAPPEAPSSTTSPRPGELVTCPAVRSLLEDLRCGA